MSANKSLDQFLEHRDRLFEELETAEQHCAATRIAVERLESDRRVGLPTSPDLQDLKGRALPRAEQRVMDLYDELVKHERRYLRSKTLTTPVAIEEQGDELD